MPRTSRGRILYGDRRNRNPVTLITVRVPVPDYMAEQMPALMPKVMDNLIPHMVRDVVPLVTGPMIDYLRGRKAPA